MESLLFLTYLAVLLLVGLLCAILSSRIRLPNILLLIIAGMLLGSVTFNGQKLIQFPPVFLTSMAILALVMIVFDSSSRFKLKEFDTLAYRALKLSFIWLIFNIIALTFFTTVIFSVGNIFLALLFAALMSGTDAGAVLFMFPKSKNSVIESLKIESLINTPLMVLLPFILLDIMKNVSQEFFFSSFLSQIFPLLQQFVTGIGAGILVGIILVKVMKHAYSTTYSPLALIVAAIITYILAENLKGNGVLAVTTLGIFFGNVYLKEKVSLQKFSSIFTTSLEILVFILVGLIIDLPLNLHFLMNSIILFILFLFIRYLAVAVSFSRQKYSFKEKVFISLNVQKGIAVAVVAFTLTTLSIPGIETILNLTLAFMLYSIILSAIMTFFQKKMLGEITAVDAKN